MSQAVDWVAIGPAVCLVGAAVVALLGDALAPATRRWLPTSASLVGIGAALALTLVPAVPRRTFCISAHPGRSGASAAGPVGCSWNVDHATVVWWGAVLLGAALVVLLLQPLAASGELPAGELHLLVLSSATGALAIAASGDLVTLLVGIELVSLPAFAMVGLRATSRGAEAALKLFLYSVVATALSLLGIAMVYGATGSLVAAPVALAGSSGSAVSPVIGMGMVLTLVALAFKVAAVPFHAWVPDIYVGAPVPVAAYLSVVSKAAGLAGLGIVLVRFFPAYDATWRPVVAAAAALTMTVGNLAALRQQHLVRLLAWSSVAQAGYLLVPLAAGGNPDDLAAQQSYLLMYAVVNLGAFAAVFAAARTGATTVSDVAGLARRRTLVGGSLAFALLCLAGLPPGVFGLWAKVVVFESAVDSGWWWLGVVLAVNVAIGLVYYLRVVAALVRSPEPSGLARPGGSGQLVSGPSGSGRSVSQPAVPGWATSVVLVVTTGAAIVLSVVPGPLFAFAYP